MQIAKSGTNKIYIKYKYFYKSSNQNHNKFARRLNLLVLLEKQIIFKNMLTVHLEETATNAINIYLK